MKTIPIGRAVLAGLLYAAAFAGEADVVDAVAEKTGDGSYRFEVTVRHADDGWEHYADQWEVLDESGVVLGTRILYHPHVQEQPFTRSLSGVEIPAGTETVLVRARDSRHEYGGVTLTVQLPQ